jgi:hypothetical protein
VRRKKAGRFRNISLRNIQLRNIQLRNIQLRNIQQRGSELSANLKSPALKRNAGLFFIRRYNRGPQDATFKQSTERRPSPQ